MKNMLTESQIKSLKKGDKLLAEVSFSSVCVDNDVICKAPFTNNEGAVATSTICLHSSCLSLPPAKPEHDPCRKFKKGDKVRLKVVNGRVPCDSAAGYDLPWNGVIYTVEMDEAESAYANCVLLTCAKLRLFVKIHASQIELVTPVEELKPYVVQESPHTYDICKRGGSKFTTFYKDQPFARENADKYCASLNDEHRK